MGARKCSVSWELSSTINSLTIWKILVLRTCPLYLVLEPKSMDLSPLGLWGGGGAGDGRGAAGEVARSTTQKTHVTQAEHCTDCTLARKDRRGSVGGFAPVCKKTTFIGWCLSQSNLGSSGDRPPASSIPPPIRFGRDTALSEAPMSRQVICSLNPHQYRTLRI